MDRSRIDKIAQTDEERLLLAKVWDKLSAAMRRDTICGTCFLTPHEQALVRMLFADASGVILFGGYPDAERKMAIYLPEYADEGFLQSDGCPVRCLRASFHDTARLTHRDFLGALTGLGIARESVGDISVGTSQCNFFVTAELAPFLLQELHCVAHAAVRVSAVHAQDVSIAPPQTVTLRDTLASLRLDGVVSAGFRISRAQAAQSIAAGKVSLDGVPCEKSDKTVAVGAKISLRGMGKIRLTAVTGQTKKGRIGVVIDRYI